MYSYLYAHLCLYEQEEGCARLHIKLLIMIDNDLHCEGGGVGGEKGNKGELFYKSSFCFFGWLVFVFFFFFYNGHMLPWKFENYSIKTFSVSHVWLNILPPQENGDQGT